MAQNLKALIAQNARDREFERLSDELNTTIGTLRELQRSLNKLREDVSLEEYRDED